MRQRDPTYKYAIKSFGTARSPIIFAHGLGCDQTMWKDVAPAFQNKHQIVLFDLMGFGNSDASHFSYKHYQALTDYADDCIEVIEHCCTEPAAFVGHSVSSMIGVLAAAKRPELFSQLVLIGPSACYLNDGDRYRGGFEKQDIEGLIDAMQSNYLGWAGQMAPAIMGNSDRPELTDTLRESFCRTNPEIARHFAALTFWSDNRSDLAKAYTPALVLQCAEDVIAPVEVGKYVADQMPNATFVQLKATGHCPHVSHPAEVIQEIERYVGSANSHL
ncbi:alpha/beta hydrolase (plasmid) [Rhizobium rosettiformans]|uniref:Alpha/beta hydrolase n=2 Tax=Rhizobium rosettiformans TaxID=1368430 RepID=A0ABX7F4Q0_9HYPH|nr:alpha/beta hydrolase [Rhizobium rosettiformans]